MLNCFFVGIGGFVGAVSRYLFTMLPIGRLGTFPIHTLLINMIGSFCIGLLAALAAKTSMPPRMMLLLKTGICGGFTTFSTFALETTELFQDGKPGFAILYMVLSLCLSVGAVWLAEMVLH